MNEDKMSVKVVKYYVQLPGLRISIKNLFHKQGEILLFVTLVILFPVFGSTATNMFAVPFLTYS